MQLNWTESLWCKQVNMTESMKSGSSSSSSLVLVWSIQLNSTRVKERKTSLRIIRGDSKRSMDRSIDRCLETRLDDVWFLFVRIRARRQEEEEAEEFALLSFAKLRIEEKKKWALAFINIDFFIIQCCKLPQPVQFSFLASWLSRFSERRRWRRRRHWFCKSINSLLDPLLLALFIYLFFSLFEI